MARSLDRQRRHPRTGTRQPRRRSAPPTAAPTATLLPGVMWHTVQPNENIVAIAFEYHTDVQVLSQLNPEITFSQCDFGNAGGRTRLHGHDLRRAADARARANAHARRSRRRSPAARLPRRRSRRLSTRRARSARRIAPCSRSDELITLRWVGSGTLSEGDTYRVHVEDLTAGRTTRRTRPICPSSCPPTGRDRTGSATITAGRSASSTVRRSRSPVFHHRTPSVYVGGALSYAEYAE